MDWLVELSWRAYPAAVLMAAGVVVAVRSVRRGLRRAQRAGRDPMRALALLQGFRAGIVGLSLVGIGAAWCWQLGWLLGLPLIIGGEELLESTVVIAALKAGREHQVSCATNGKCAIRWQVPAAGRVQVPHPTIF